MPNASPNAGPHAMPCSANSAADWNQCVGSLYLALWCQSCRTHERVTIDGLLQRVCKYTTCPKLILYFSHLLSPRHLNLHWNPSPSLRNLISYLSLISYPSLHAYCCPLHILNSESCSREYFPGDSWKTPKVNFTILTQLRLSITHQITSLPKQPSYCGLQLWLIFFPICMLIITHLPTLRTHADSKSLKSTKTMNA